MNYKNTTHVPNRLFDVLLSHLTHSELMIYLIITRKTNGWIDKRTGKRKRYDRITHRQFMKHTGLSRRTISTSISSLISKRLITVKGYNVANMMKAENRRGQRLLWYGLRENGDRLKSIIGRV
jgi:hypothetical protein